MKTIVTFLILTLLVAAGCNNDPEPKATMPAETTKSAGPGGEQLFKINCAQCHMPAKDFAAPALAGVADRWKDKTLLYDFVRNSSEVIARDAYAEALFEKWNQAPMLPYPQLTNADIDAILAYCNEVAADKK